MTLQCTMDHSPLFSAHTFLKLEHRQLVILHIQSASYGSKEHGTGSMQWTSISLGHWPELHVPMYQPTGLAVMTEEATPTHIGASVREPSEMKGLPKIPM